MKIGTGGESATLELLGKLINKKKKKKEKNIFWKEYEKLGLEKMIGKQKKN